MEATKTSYAADVAAALEDRTMPLAELVELVGEKAVASAWARGDIELGRRVRCVTGRPGFKDGRSTLVVEEPTEWTGEKRKGQQPLAAILAETLPACEFYRRYDRTTDPVTGEDAVKPVNITRAQAEELCRLSVRLTDKGLAALQPA